MSMNMIKSIVCILVALVFTQNLAAQVAETASPYKNFANGDVVVLGASALIGGFNLYLDHKMTPFTPELAAKLDRHDINKFDRSATFNLSPQSAKLSDYGLKTCMLLPLGLLAGTKVRDHSMDVAYLYLETMAITGVLTDFTKLTVQRIRPWAYNEDVPLENKKGKDIKKSFFSGHTSTSFAGAIFFAKVFNDFYPDSQWKPYVWGGSIALASTVGYLRVRAGRHFPTDVLVGALVGGAIGYFVPELHKNDKTNVTLQTSYTSPMMIGFQVSF